MRVQPGNTAGTGAGGTLGIVAEEEEEEEGQDIVLSPK